MAYVYGHYKADTGELFYIGKGSGDRAWSTNARRRKTNPHWNNVVNKHGLMVRILHDKLTDEEAYAIEKQMIAEVGIENLVNLTEGGDGISSKYAKNRSKSAEWRENHKNAMKERWKDPEYRRKMSDVAKRRMADLTIKEKVSKKNKAIFSTAEKRADSSLNAKKYWSDVDTRKQQSERMKRIAQSEEWRSAVSLRQKNMRKVVCEFCGKEVTPQVLGRYHKNKTCTNGE